MTPRPEVGARREVVVCPEITRTQIVQFAGASGDYSVLHTDEPAARALGQPGLMAHGMLTMGLTSQVVTEWFGDDSLRTLEARFTSPVWPGDRLTSTATVEAVDSVGALATARLALETRNGAGDVVLVGKATVSLDYSPRLA
jgi:acyl dehydratase